jgi:acetone carboxylase gamma subunit
MPHIIDPKPHHSVVREKICTSCGIRFGFTPSEAKEKYYRDYGGGGDTYLEINCPGCGTLHQVLK